MRIEDINYLKRNIQNLPVIEKKGENNIKPLSNLFVVASQAHTVQNGNPNTLNEILRVGYRNFMKTITPEYWNHRKEISGYEKYGEAILPQRFFTYTIDIPKLCNQFNEELRTILEALPVEINNKAKKYIKEYVANRKPNLMKEINNYEKLLKNRDDAKLLLDNINANALDRERDNDKQKKRIKDLIEKLLQESEEMFNRYCSENINSDAIVEKIKLKGIKNNNDDIECFASQLQEEVQQKCSSILEEKSKLLAEECKKYIENYTSGVNIAFKNTNIEVDFDAGYAFVQSLAKLGFVGGLGAFLLAEAPFWLQGVAFFVNPLLGPIGIAASLLISAALGIAKLFGGGWEKSVAKKIIKAYEKNNVVDTYRTAIKDYWRKTESAFLQSTSDMEDAWNKYVKDLEKKVNECDIHELKNIISELNNINVFFENIPL